MKTPLLFLLLVLILSPCIHSRPSNNEIVNQIFYGVFAQNQLEQPQYCLKCFDDVTAQKIVLFADQILPELARLLPPFQKLKNQFTDFINSFDSSVIWCLGYSYEIQFLGQKFGIEAGSSAAEIGREFELYYVKHEEKTHKVFQDLNNLWKAQNYKQAGFDGSVFVHTVIDGKNSLIVQ